MTQPRFDVEQFVYLKILAGIGPLERAERFEEPIDAALAEDDLGEVSGGGSSLGDARPDGSRPIEFCGVDIDTRDRDAALKVLRVVLPGLGLPRGSELHYTAAGRRLQDVWLDDRWTIGQPRTFRHPGFDV